MIPPPPQKLTSEFQDSHWGNKALMSNATLFFTVFTLFVLEKKRKKTPIGWHQHAVKKDVRPPHVDKTKAREQAELLTVVMVAAARLTCPPVEIKERKKKKKQTW